MNIKTLSALLALMSALLEFQGVNVARANDASSLEREPERENEAQENQESLLDILSPAEVAKELGMGNESTPEPQTEVTPWMPIRIAQPRSSVNPTRPAPFFSFSLGPNGELRGIPNNEDLDKSEIFIMVNKAPKGSTAQRLKLFHRGTQIFEFPVSTGKETTVSPPKRDPYLATTPMGFFRPRKDPKNPNFPALVKHYVSKAWDAPMDNAVFLIGGIALHATTPSHFHELGRRASGGCVRLHPDNAEKVFNLIKDQGKSQVAKVQRYTGMTIVDIDDNIITEDNYNTVVVIHNTLD